MLNAGLEQVRQRYDVIVIDTPPPLSYVTINGLWAADGLIVPVPPSGLDVASSAWFWPLLVGLGGNLDRRDVAHPRHGVVTPGSVATRLPPRRSP